MATNYQTFDGTYNPNPQPTQPLYTAEPVKIASGEVQRQYNTQNAQQIQIGVPNFQPGSQAGPVGAYNQGPAGNNHCAPQQNTYNAQPYQAPVPGQVPNY